MLSKLKEFWSRVTAGREPSEAGGPAVPPVEYKGYRIRPTPFRTNSLYQTAGTI